MLTYIDWIIIAAYLVFSLLVGLWYRKQAGNSMSDFFLGGRNLPWYMAGISLAATTFAADTPLAVTELVGNGGISGNWLWWNALMGGMLTVFFFAHLWRRANILTEVEFIELRYTGKEAAFLRGFKALYLGVFMNLIIIGWVNLAMITILQGFMGLSYQTAILTCGALTILVGIYSSLSGLLGVVVTDVVQFFIAMLGCILLAYLVINSDQIGGIAGLKTALPEGALQFLPALSNESGNNVLTISIAQFIAFFGFLWWSSWYPGAEPGGGGYVAQRIMSTRSEKDAVYATLLFQITHYCLRPWPWILVGLAAMVLYNVPQNIQDKELQTKVIQLQKTHHLKDNVFAMSEKELNEKSRKDKGIQGAGISTLYEINQSLAKEASHNKPLEKSLEYSKDKRFGYVFAMKDFLPAGFVGLLLVAFFAAYMSTISTQLNWGTSYVIHDFYGRFIKPTASEKDLLNVSRIITLSLTVLGLVVTTFIESISGVWSFIMECGAGLGLVLILRWYWWRISAWSEIAATIAPFLGYSIGKWGLGWEFPDSLFFTVGFTTVTWLIVTFLTPPTERTHLQAFYQRIRPAGFWTPIRESLHMAEEKSDTVYLVGAWLTAIIFTYSVLFLIGDIILAKNGQQISILFFIAVVSLIALQYFLNKTKLFSKKN